MNWSDLLIPLQIGSATEYDYGALPNVELRLADVPELGYFTTDKPRPRGELLVRSEAMVHEYYKDHEATGLYPRSVYSLKAQIGWSLQRQTSRRTASS